MGVKLMNLFNFNDFLDGRTTRMSHSVYVYLGPNHLLLVSEIHLRQFSVKTEILKWVFYLERGDALMEHFLTGSALLRYHISKCLGP